jgi:ATP-dependent helicase/nuclease subunit A
VTLDRTFVADGVRWIVDYKTGSHAGGDPEGFLDRERERYRAQLERYAAFVRALDPQPIRVALYFPLVADGWRDWAYDG